MRKWKQVLAICLTGAMLTTCFSVQTFATEDISPDAENESAMTQESGEVTVETEEIEETEAEVSDEDTIPESSENSADSLTVEEEKTSVVMEGEDTVSGTADDGTNWSFTKSTGLLVMTAGETGNDLTKMAIPGEYYDGIKYLQIFGFETIHDDAFYSTPNLKSVSMDDTVTAIGGSAFSYCLRLESVRLSENLTTIDYSAFSKCPKLSEITIPSTVTRIGRYAFLDDPALMDITIMSMECEFDLKSVGYMLGEEFVKNTGLTIHCYPSSTAEEYANTEGFQIDLIGDHFAGTCGENLRWEINYEKKRLNIRGQGAMEEYIVVSPPWAYLNDYINQISIGAGVTSITDYVFYNQVNVTKVSIPESVTSIGAQAFLGCSSLKEVTLTNKKVEIGEHALGFIPNYSTDIPDKISGFVLKGYTGSTAESYAKANGITFVSLNDQDVVEGECGAYLTWRYTKATGLLEIMGNGLMPDFSNSGDNLPPWSEIVGAENIKSISMEDTVNSIGAYAFSGMTKVKILKLPHDLWSVGDHALEGCTALAQVQFNDELGEIGEYGFAGCTSLTAVNLPEDFCKLRDHAFENCKSIKKIVLPMGIGYYNANLGQIGCYAFAGCSGLTDLVVKNAQDISKGCFQNCTSLKNVTFSDRTVFIEESAFEGCTSLAAITLPEYLYYVGARAFYNCPSLKLVTDNCRREPEDRDYMKVFMSGYNIGAKAFGYLSSTGTAEEKVSGLTIRGYERAASVAYAKENGIKYEIIPYPVSGSCGDHATWNYNTKTKTLTVKGTGATIDWETEFISEAEYTSIPNEWFGWNFDVKKIVVEEGITIIGNCTFMVMENVTEISLPDSLKEIRDGSFYALNSLKEIHFPKKIQKISDQAFYYSAPDTIYGYSGTESERFATLWGKKFVDCTSVDELEQKTVSITKTQMGSGYISITWNAVTPVDSYRIYRCVDSGKMKLIKTVSADTLTYKDTDVEVGKTYKYQAVGAYGTARSQKTAKSLKYVQIPKVSVVQTVEGVTISWPKKGGVSGYRLYCKDAETGKNTKIATLSSSKTSYTQKKLTSGNKYTYTIHAYKGTDVIVYGQKSMIRLDAPKLTAARAAKGNAVNLKWTKVKGAKGYYIYRKTGTGSYTKIATVKSGSTKSYVDRKAVRTKSYTYAVKAYNGNSQSGYKAVKVK